MHSTAYYLGVGVCVKREEAVGWGEGAGRQARRQALSVNHGVREQHNRGPVTRPARVDVIPTDPTARTARCNTCGWEGHGDGG